MLTFRGLKFYNRLITQLPFASQRFKYNKDVVILKPDAYHRPEPLFGIRKPIPPFDISKVIVCRGLPEHKDCIIDFLKNHYWPREPLTTGLYMDLKSTYLDAITLHYVTSGKSYLAYQDTGSGPVLLGVCLAQTMTPYIQNAIKKDGTKWSDTLEGNRLLFLARCLTKADTFNKYNLHKIYHIEVLATHPSVSRLGVGTLLIKTALCDAILSGNYCLFQVLATSDHVGKICRRLRMREECSLVYREFTDYKGDPIFYPRRPHLFASVYTRDCTKRPNAWTEPELYKTFKKLKEL